MRWSRRRFIVTLAASPLFGEEQPEVPAAALRKVIDATRKSGFGMVSGQARDSSSLYRADTPGGAPVTFDVSNNFVMASFSVSGAPLRLCSAHGVEALPPAEVTGGVYSKKLMRRRVAAPMELRVDGKIINNRPADRVDLLDNFLPLFHWNLEGATVRQLVFAPQDSTSQGSSSAIRVLFLIENTRPTPIQATLRAGRVVTVRRVRRLFWKQLSPSTIPPDR